MVIRSLIFSLLSLLMLNSSLSLAATSLFDSSSPNLLSQKQQEFAPVEQAFEFSFEQKNNQVLIHFNILPEYYLYKNQFKTTSQNAIIEPVNLPQGIPHFDEFFGEQEVYKNTLDFTVIVQQSDASGTLKIRYQGCAEKGLCYSPQIQKIPLGIINAHNDSTSTAVLAALDNTTSDTLVNSTQSSSQASKTKPVSEQNRLADMLAQDNLWLTLVAFFVGGLLLAFTPCVFPMYPILTGIIVGQGKQLTTKRAFMLSFVYVQGMAVTYTILGVIVALAGAQFQAMFQHPIVLISLSVLFVVLAFSMFGFYNLSLPAAWQQKLNNVSNQQQSGSFIGVLLMGVISGLVASPCTTAPLTGALLYISQSGNVALGASALYALSLGMGLPLILLGSSGGKLLPKAGAWMNIVKHTFGFLLLAVPVFLLQRIMPESLGLALMAGLIFIASIYYFVENQSTQAGIGYGIRFAIIWLMLLGSSINILNYLGFLPFQQTTHIAQTNTKNPVGQFIKVNSDSELLAQVASANAQGKTVMVDLYADWCIACKEFEKYTFFKPNVQQALRNTVMIQIDLTDTASPDNAYIMDKYQIFGLPSILFFDINGNELKDQRVTGFMGADEFTEHLNRIFGNN